MLAEEVEAGPMQDTHACTNTHKHTLTHTHVHAHVHTYTQANAPMSLADNPHCCPHQFNVRPLLDLRWRASPSRCLAPCEGKPLGTMVLKSYDEKVDARRSR